MATADPTIYMVNNLVSDLLAFLLLLVFKIPFNLCEFYLVEGFARHDLP